MSSQNKKPHVLVFLPDRFNKPYGGMGENSKFFLEQLSGDFDFSVVGFPDPEPAPAFVKNYRGALNPLPEISVSHLITLFGQISYLSEAISIGIRPDIIYAYDWSAYLAALKASEYFQAPLVVRVSLSPTRMLEDGFPLGLNIQNPAEVAIHQSLCEMERIGLERARSIIHISKGYSRRFQSDPRVSIVPNGIDLERWHTARPYRLPGEGRIKVIYIGRFVPVKGVHLLLDATIPKDVDLIFVGGPEGSMAGLYERTIERSGISKNIHYIGALHGQEKIDALSSADAVIMPSLHEPFGTVALEAFASKSILITTGVDGLSDFVNESNAIICEKSVAGIEKALSELVLLGPEKREDMIQNGLAVCEIYSLKKSVKALKEAFLNVLK
jgi:glycosyltransferase involved in cell wall biosynthesis